MFAAYKGSKKAVKLLIKAGANVNAKENDGYAVLSVAAMEHTAYRCHIKHTTNEEAHNVLQELWKRN